MAWSYSRPLRVFDLQSRLCRRSYDDTAGTDSLVNSFGLPADIQAGFDTQLQAVQTDLTNNNPAQACSDLTAFINHVQAQSGKHLTMSQANQLIKAAKQVQAVLGC